MVDLILSVILLAMIALLAYLIWRLILKTYVTKMKAYIPDTIKKFREKQPIDMGQFLINALWSICCIYVACRIVVMGAQAVVVFIKEIMEVI